MLNVFSKTHFKGVFLKNQLKDIIADDCTYKILNSYTYIVCSQDVERFNTEFLYKIARSFLNRL